MLIGTSSPGYETVHVSLIFVSMFVSSMGQLNLCSFSTFQAYAEARIQIYFVDAVLLIAD